MKFLFSFFLLFIFILVLTCVTVFPAGSLFEDSDGNTNQGEQFYKLVRKKRIEDLKKNIDILKKRVELDKYQDEVEKQKLNTKKVEGSVQALSARLDQVLSDMKQVKSKIEKLEKENITLKIQNRTLLNSIEKYNDRSDSFILNSGVIKNGLKSTAIEIMNLRDRIIKNLNIINEIKKNQEQNFMKTVRSVKSVKDETSDNFKKVNDSIVSLKNEINSKVDSDKFDSIIIEITKKIETQKGEAKHTEQEEADKTDHYKNLKNTLKDLYKVRDKRGNIKNKIKEAAVASERKEYEKAEKLYKQILDTEPDNIRALSGLADLYIKTGKNYNEAIILITRVLYLDKGNRRYHLISLGEIYYEAGNYDKAKKYLLDANRLIRKSEIELKSRALLNLGKVYYRLKKNDEAFLYLVDVVKLDTTSKYAMEAMHYLDSL